MAVSKNSARGMIAVILIAELFVVFYDFLSAEFKDNRKNVKVPVYDWELILMKCLIFSLAFPIILIMGKKEELRHLAKKPD